MPRLAALALLVACAIAAPGDYFQMPIGWTLQFTDLHQYGPCNGTQVPAPTPEEMMVYCDTDPLCLTFNVVPVQPGTNLPCGFIKSQVVDNKIVSFVHRTRCNDVQNAEIVSSAGGVSYKYCQTVGDAQYTQIGVYDSPGPTSYATCQAICDAEPKCAAVSTNGQNCTLFTTATLKVCGMTPPGCDAWFKIY